MPAPTTNDRDRSVGWLSGLDGLRAVAVLAVMVFHFAPDVLPGGFLGVDLFFAISGYLITRLLLAEIDRTGRLDLVGFYRRRWRRLFPAVLVLLVVLTLACVFVWHDELPTLRGGALAGAGFGTNWWLIFDHQSYFVASGRPPMMQHLWSLAIEEQFYLVWPVLLAVIVAVGALRRAGRADVVLTRGRLLRVAVVAAVLAMGSAVWMDVLADRADIPYGGDSARVYFGTDTHASGLLFGAAFGALSLWGQVAPDPLRTVRPDRPRWFRRARAAVGRWLLGLVSVGALALLGWQAHRVTEFDPALYRGGFGAFSLLAAILVATVAGRSGPLRAVLDLPLLRWIGQRSYALYLWHWPVAVVTRPGIDITGPHWLLIANQFAITTVLAAASHRFVEAPFRAGAFGRWWSAAPTPRVVRPEPVNVRPERAPAARLGWRVAAGALTAALVVAAVGVAQSGQRPARAESPVSPSASTPTPGVDRLSASGPLAAPPRTPIPAPASTVPTARSAPPPSVATLAVSAFGDSVMLGAAPALVADLPAVQVSAVEGRQARSVFADVAAHRADGTLRADVVIHTGDNGIISPTDLAATLSALADRRRVVLVTTRVPREWQGPNNATIKRVARSFANVRVVDWLARSTSHAGWFYADGLHLRAPGAAAYAALIRTALLAG